MGLRGPKPRDRSLDTPETRAAYGRARLHEEREAARRAVVLRGAHSAGIDQLPRATVSKQQQPMSADVVVTTQPKPKPKPPKPRNTARVLYAKDYESECFESLTWRADPSSKNGTDGTVEAVFRRGGDLIYWYNISRDQAREWFTGGLGEFFNDEVR